MELDRPTRTTVRIENCVANSRTRQRNYPDGLYESDKAVVVGALLGALVGLIAGANTGHPAQLLDALIGGVIGGVSLEIASELVERFRHSFPMFYDRDEDCAENWDA